MREEKPTEVNCLGPTFWGFRKMLMVMCRKRGVLSSIGFKHPQCLDHFQKGETSSDDPWNAGHTAKRQAYRHNFGGEEWKKKTIDPWISGGFEELVVEGLVIWYVFFLFNPWLMYTSICTGATFLIGRYMDFLVSWTTSPRWMKTQKWPFSKGISRASTAVTFSTTRLINKRVFKSWVYLVMRLHPDWRTRELGRIHKTKTRMRSMSSSQPQVGILWEQTCWSWWWWWRRRL